MPLVEYADYIEDQPEKYDESDDEDFNPDSAPPDEASSESDDDASTPAQRNGKRKAPLDEDLDSGDEVTIKAARKRKSKKQKKGKKGADEDDVILSDGEGGLVKTRAQRRVEQVERRPLARTEGATVDVDALWAQMTAAPLQPVQPTKPQEPATALDQSTPPSIPTKTPVEDEEEQIRISKTYTFAGQDTTEEKSIPRSHLAKHTADGWAPVSSKPTPTDADDKPKANTSKTRRPLRRPSRFDPNPTGFVRTLAPEFQLTYPRATSTTAPNREMPPPELPAAKGKEKATKLNVVDKSRMDWSGFVDKEGIAEELDTHGKTKEAYLGRMEFLAGVEARREEERKNVKAKGLAAAGPGVG